jgi:RimJ/RimL family protein N-acetyltransferase
MFETSRLVIRRFRPDDWPDLHEYLSDPAVVRYEPYPVYTEAESQREAASRAGSEAFWAVCLKEDGKLIGNLYFARQAFDTWELGYVFNRQYQGKGYAIEAARKLVDYAFREGGARRIIAMCDPRNEHSWRLLERLGMRREGHFLQTGYFKTDAHGNPLWHDTYEYAVLASEWPEKF